MIVTNVNMTGLLNDVGNTYKLYSAVHSHRHGDSFYIFFANGLPTETEFVRAFQLDFEPELDEYIVIDECVEIKKLELT